MAGVAFLFPGQGSQKIGMGKALCDEWPEARAVFAEADAALGFSLSQLCFAGPEPELTLTANAQPAILTTSIAALRVLEKETGLHPVAVAGHSLGEYSALVAADALDLGDAARLVHLRGRFMQDAVPPGVGAMAAVIGLGQSDVEAVCAEATVAAADEVVSPANFNGGGQVVIAGHKTAVDRACVAAKARGAKMAKLLAVSAPFHCALMRPAADRLAAELSKVTFRSPRVPVISNVKAAPYQDAALVREFLIRQVTSPVRWEESVLYLASQGINEGFEVGAGAVLAGLIKRIAPGLTVRPAGDPAAIHTLRQAADGASRQEARHG
ncbi:MAG: [acyl-carrier-protein] S-malonyltransferase [Myxococcales bacterium]|jgi:[acyl-carrier-protein] S-malonyltransferase|nr:[acyl-carrier-protein] S-malonyltransferase [Myxococcales bacterium]